MENRLEKKYGLFTAIAMVIGIVIGSGVFFKAPAILNAAGTLATGIAAWIIGGAIMIFCAGAFAAMGTKYEKVNGIVDYAEAAIGRRYGYFIGWFMATIYYPSLTGVLAYVSAIYFCMLTGWIGNPAAVWAVSAIFLALSFLLNSLAPRLAGKWQVSTTLIKLVPLVAMAVGGIIYGLGSGNLTTNFHMTMENAGGSGNPLFYGVVATSFAYEGWIIATSINSEIKNAKKTLPLALVLGGIVIVVIYLVYFIGIAGGVELSVLSDKSGVEVAYENVFGKAIGTVLTAFITISCLGTLNGLTMGCTRGIYSIAVRGEGPAIALFSKVSPKYKMPMASCVFGFVMAFAFMAYFLPIDYNGLYGQGGGFFFDVSELPIITIYAMYIPIFIRVILREKAFGTATRFVFPTLAICGCLFMVTAAVDKFRYSGLWQYLLIFAAVMALGMVFYRKLEQK
ncbi:MAG TPA: amino acid permease [Clostridiales bacterium]|nr:amino acid permease [Clostridiales bacterium]